MRKTLSIDAAEVGIDHLIRTEDADNLLSEIMELVRNIDPADLPQGIDDIVRIVNAWLDRVYPEKVFGKSSDPGPMFIAKLRALLAEWR
jgi:hypothetical protein